MAGNYRDETTAALARAESLERENAELREALRDKGLVAPEKPGAPNPSAGQFSLVAIFAVPALGGLVLVAVVVWLVLSQ